MQEVEIERPQEQTLVIRVDHEKDHIYTLLEGLESMTPEKSAVLAEVLGQYFSGSVVDVIGFMEALSRRFPGWHIEFRAVLKKNRDVLKDRPTYEFRIFQGCEYGCDP